MEKKKQQTNIMNGGQGIMGGGQNQGQGLMGGQMPQGSVAGMISNLGQNPGAMQGNLNQFMGAPFQQVGGPPQQPQFQPVDTGSVAYMNNQQQGNIAQQNASGAVNFQDYANSHKSAPPPPVEYATAEDAAKAERIKIAGYDWLEDDGMDYY